MPSTAIIEPNPVAGVFADGTALVDRIFAIMLSCVVFLHRVALGIGVAQGEGLVPRLIRRAKQLTLRFVVFIVACDILDPLKDAARVIRGRDIRRAVFREAAEKSGFAPRRRRERCQREQDEPPRTTPAARRRARAPAPAGSPGGRSPSIVISAAFASVHDLAGARVSLAFVTA
jgi:hypothetical protein